MDFGSITTDELLAALPADSEDDRWELKSASYLAPVKRGELKKELGKQVSAFANSGGGYLVFGISDDRQLEACETAVGRQPMKDYLATMVEQSVEYPIRHFRVHRVPFKSDPDKAVFVIAIEDSPAAPHQAKEERVYYYRIDGHSKPAPHFHVELLRNRVTKAVLQIADIDYTLQTPQFGDAPRLNIALRVDVENISLQCATHWGIHVKHPRENYRWTFGPDRKPLTEGLCVHGEQPVLLPSQRVTVIVHISGASEHVNMQPILAFDKLWEDFGVLARPLSQNHVGEQVCYGWNNAAEWILARRRLHGELMQHGIRDF